MAAWLGAEQAAGRLGVKPATLYAYVSRGQLRRRVGPDGRRSEYHPDDVAALAVRGRRARPSRASDIVLPTAITAITSSGPAYRGALAIDLAGTASFEVVAERLWDVTVGRPWLAPDASSAAARVAVGAIRSSVEPAALLPAIVAAARTADPLRGDLERPAVTVAARGLIATILGVLGREAELDEPVARRVAVAVTGREHPEVTACLDAALVLLADHELASSTLAARVAASARCDPYAVVLAGSAVLTGSRHGAASRPLELALGEVAAGRDPAAALAEVQRAAGSSGFGHPLYPDGDPRAARLLELSTDAGLLDPNGAAGRVLDAAAARGLEPPSIDAALAGLTHAIGAPPGTGELVFAVARIAGWIAHALEQYADAELLRPRAVFTGG